MAWGRAQKPITGRRGRLSAWSWEEVSSFSPEFLLMLTQLVDTLGQIVEASMAGDEEEQRLQTLYYGALFRSKKVCVYL